MTHGFDYYGFVYLWKDIKNQRFYLGSHFGSFDDNYICSSKWMKNAYNRRPDDFKRKIIYIHKSSDKRALLDEEQRWLNMIKPHELSTSKNVMDGSNRYYNMKSTASGGNGGGNKGKIQINGGKE